MSKKKDAPPKEDGVKENPQPEIQEVAVEDPIKTLEHEIDILKDQLLRNQAELQNFKRRTNEERIKDRIFANTELVKRLLITVDNMEIGLKNETENGALKFHVKGFEMIYRDLLEALKDEGLQVIEALDQPFDPNLHQAVAQENVEDKEANIVIEVYQKGYTFKNRVIRPAMVKVTE